MILLVEDDKDMASLIKEFLEYSGLECEVAHCLQEVNEKLKVHKFNCAIVDLGLGPEDGLNVIPLIDSRPKNANIPIVISSGFVPVQAKSHPRVACTLQKPYNLFNLVEQMTYFDTPLEKKETA